MFSHGRGYCRGLILHLLQGWLAARATFVLSGHSEGLLEGAFVVTGLFYLAGKLTDREENLMQPVGGTLQHLRDAVTAMLLHQAAHDVHVHRPCNTIVCQAPQGSCALMFQKRRKYVKTSCFSSAIFNLFRMSTTFLTNNPISLKSLYI